jgi:hypothetical protein
MRLEDLPVARACPKCGRPPAVILQPFESAPKALVALCRACRGEMFRPASVPGAGAGPPAEARARAGA